MAKAESPEQAAERLAAERELVTCRFCGGKPTRFPPPERRQTDAVCDACSEFPPTLSAVDALVELVKPPNKDEVKVYVDGIRHRLVGDFSVNKAEVDWKARFDMKGTEP